MKYVNRNGTNKKRACKISTDWSMQVFSHPPHGKACRTFAKGTPGQLRSVEIRPTAGYPYFGVKRDEKRQLVKVCGLIPIRQHPGTAKGVQFITIKNETGFANPSRLGKDLRKIPQRNPSDQAAYGDR